jgi:hypothetical protein
MMHAIHHMGQTWLVSRDAIENLERPLGVSIQILSSLIFIMCSQCTSSHVFCCVFYFSYVSLMLKP